MDFKLKDKRVIVTGGSRGIGLSIAREFAKEGAAVSICARGQESLGKARSLLEKSGGKVHVATCDVSDPPSLQEYIEDAVAALSGLNILVNNPSGFGRTDDEAGWQAGLDIDLMALVRGSWAAVPHIEKAGGGALIHTSSISGLTSSLRTPPYGAVKAAVIQYTKTQALQLASKNIRVNCIAPGSIEFAGGTWDDAKKNNPTLYQGIQKSIPFGRLGQPDEVAKLAVFLGSDVASWITGQTIAVDGGQML
ncbi:MAG: SDR family oxidoreductase [Rhodospirillaceae bacterium]|jgi:3-oxoacyl-[acyl-carrier protein] reductase|nr:SDR family oxidoreductase [Rhodospirillaceae bacterium]MBT5912627.1 SDR family oxidoreductase [Rhodospirillaceae bacterium]MBT6306633.1 SDR family oxidoreductase [Rhodospirillaceae bacterium]MBT7732174.1 SDR family oxidoreductase [Rhodospirillaceae bacterium]MDC1442627.1 SDR family oxidoreductase [Rhodospirillaceae bacterium]